MHAQMHDTVGVSFHTIILCLFHHACNDFAEECVKFGSKSDTSKSGSKKEIEILYFGE